MMKNTDYENSDLNDILTGFGEIDLIAFQKEIKTQNKNYNLISYHIVNLFALFDNSFIDKNIQALIPLIINVICSYPDKDVKMNSYNLMVQKYNEAKKSKNVKISILKEVYLCISSLNENDIFLLIQIIMDSSNADEGKILFGIKLLLSICFFMNPKSISGIIWPYLWDIYCMYNNKDICISTVSLCATSISLGYESLSTEMLQQFLIIALSKKPEFMEYNIQLFTSLWIIFIFKDINFYEEITISIIKRYFENKTIDDVNTISILELLLKAIILRVLIKNDNIKIEDNISWKTLKPSEVAQWLSVNSMLMDTCINITNDMNLNYSEHISIYMNTFVEFLLSQLRMLKSETTKNYQQLKKIYISTWNFFTGNLIQKSMLPYINEMRQVQQDQSQLSFSDSTLLFFYMEAYYDKSIHNPTQIFNIPNFTSLLEECCRYFKKTANPTQCMFNMHKKLSKLESFQTWAALYIQNSLLEDKTEDFSVLISNLTALIVYMDYSKILSYVIPILQYMEDSNNQTYHMQSLRVAVISLINAQEDDIKELLHARILSFIENWNFKEKGELLKETIKVIFYYCEICPIEYFFAILYKFLEIYKWTKVREVDLKSEIMSFITDRWVFLLLSDNFQQKISIGYYIKYHLEKVLVPYLTSDITNSYDMCIKLTNAFSKFSKNLIDKKKMKYRSWIS